jgi:hypothetical protein
LTPPPTLIPGIDPEPVEPVVQPITEPDPVASAQPLGFATVYEDWVTPPGSRPQPVWRIVWRVEWDAVEGAEGYTVHVADEPVSSVTNEGPLAYEYETVRSRQDPAVLTPAQAVERDQTLTTLTTWGNAPVPVSWVVL